MIKNITATENILNYIRENSLRELGICRLLREETANLSERNMQILPEQGQFFSLLIKLIKARNALEIGVFTGYSSLCIAQALPDNGKLIACDNNVEWTTIAKKYWNLANVSDKIDLRLDDACQSLQSIHSEKGDDYFDFVFIDADKENYDNYYEMCLKLLKPGGLIVFDNTLWSGHVADVSVDDEETNALRKINAKLLKDTRIDLSMLPFADGITLVCKK